MLQLDISSFVESNTDSFLYYKVSNNNTVSIKCTNGKTPFHMFCKEGQFDVVELKVNKQFIAFSINLNAQHVNGMTPYMYGYKIL